MRFEGGAVSSKKVGKCPPSRRDSCVRARWWNERWVFEERPTFKGEGEKGVELVIWGPLATGAVSILF